MTKIKVTCPNCQGHLVTTDDKSGTVSLCPKCGSHVPVPYGGIGIGSYWAIRIGSFFAFVFLGAVMKDASILLFPVAVVVFWTSTYHRNINIGNPWHQTLWGLIPGSIFYFGFASEGSGRKRKNTVTISPSIPAIAPPVHSIPSLEEVESRLPRPLEKFEKQVILDIMDGDSIELAATNAEIETNTARDIYGAFYKALNSQPESERKAYLEMILR